MRPITRLYCAALAALTLTFFFLPPQNARTQSRANATAQAAGGLNGDDGAAFQEAPAVTTATPVAAAITGVSTGGVGYAAYQQTGTVVTGTIGRWDAAYPGHQEGDLEPLGFSYLYIDVDVNDGGLVNFEYILNTYDAGI